MTTGLSIFFSFVKISEGLHIYFFENSEGTVETQNEITWSPFRFGKAVFSWMKKEFWNAEPLDVEGYSETLGQ